MKQFQNILYVIQDSELNDIAFGQAAKLIKAAEANLTFLVLCPALSSDMKDIQEAFEKGLKDSILAKLEAHNIRCNPSILFETATPHFVTIIQHVLKKDCDLVIKQAESLNKKHNKGFKSLDMSLLRKCPCPVFLCRDTSNWEAPEILTAIDPSSIAPEGHDLSIKLLKTGQFLAEKMGGHNTVISCWDFEYEEFLRHSPFAKMESSKVDSLIKEAQENHRHEMNKLISEAGIASPRTVYQRGKPYEIIPAYTQSKVIDMVVMGTVARTGIPGFTIGNTAENILNNLSCGMFALKPNGFISPIKAY